MKTSVVIRTRDEAARLRLTLASLEGQAGLDEIAVADDGSTDETPEVLARAVRRLPVRSLRHPEPLGRSAAANAAATLARGDLLLFLDGDTLAGPGMIARHVAAHRAHGPGRAALIGRGETWHLRCTRFLADPESGECWPAMAARVERMPMEERAALRVTRDQVLSDFTAVTARAGPGIYPGAAPRRLHEAEMRALRDGSSERSWAAASGSNFSVRRDAFHAAGGFDPAIDINEHRELAYRLCRRGARVAAIEGARSYHLTHREGWRDPLADTAWERRFRARHPEAPIEALIAFWTALSGDTPAPDFFG